MKYYKFRSRAEFAYHRTVEAALRNMPRSMRLELRECCKRPVDTDTVFDYFHTIEPGEEDYYDEEARARMDVELLDIYETIASTSNHIFVSAKFKDVLERFKICRPYRFYPAKLLFKGEKFDYFLFVPYTDSFDSVIFPLSTFWQYDIVARKILPELGECYLRNRMDYEETQRPLPKNVRLQHTKLTLHPYYDLIRGIGGVYSVSERLKKAIEDAGIRFIEFEELKEEIHFLDEAPPIEGI